MPCHSCMDNNGRYQTLVPLAKADRVRDLRGVTRGRRQARHQRGRTLDREGLRSDRMQTTSHKRGIYREIRRVFSGDNCELVADPSKLKHMTAQYAQARKKETSPPNNVGDSIELRDSTCFEINIALWWTQNIDTYLHRRCVNTAFCPHCFIGGRGFSKSKSGRRRTIYLHNSIQSDEMQIAICFPTSMFAVGVALVLKVALCFVFLNHQENVAKLPSLQRTGNFVRERAHEKKMLTAARKQQDTP